MIIKGVNILAQAGITEQEIEEILAAEQKSYQAEGKKIAKIELMLDGEEIVVKSVAKSPIRRVRRITGYLSDEQNFNDAKRAELKDRKSHVG